MSTDRVYAGALEGAGPSKTTISGPVPLFCRRVQTKATLWRPEEHKVAVVQRLLEMSRGEGGAVCTVWWEGGLPRVRYVLWGPVEILTWMEAEEMTGIYWPESISRKAPAREVRGRLAAASGF